jgi:plastocyanin
MNKNLLAGLGVFLAIIIAGFYFVNNTKVKPNPSQKSGITASTVPSGPVKTFSVSAKEFAYTPSTITVNKGDVVRINFTNDGTTTHNFAITELGVSTKAVGPGGSDSISFTPEEAGTYTFFCSIDGHKSLGLEGTLTVQ